MKNDHQHGMLYTCFVEFCKAFDTIPRDKLWQHLANIGLYIDQLELYLQSHAQEAPQLLDQKVPILLYADDIVLLSCSSSGLQHLLHVLQLFCAEKLLSVNMAKTQVVIFNDFRHSHTDSFMYAQQPLQIVDQ